jgi:hypothetical protein
MPAPVNGAAPAAPAPLSTPPLAPPPLTYIPPPPSVGPAGPGCSSCGAGCWGGSCHDRCYYEGFPYVWATADYLHLWFKEGFLPALVTTGPGPALPTLDRFDTVLARGGGLDITSHPGGLLTVGFGIPSDHPADVCCVAGVELTGFFVAQKGNVFRAASDGVPVIGRPIVDVTTGTPVDAAQVVAGVNPAVRGAVQVDTQNGLYGVEANGVCLLTCDASRGYRLDLLVGGRYLALHEDVVVTEDRTAVATGERQFIRDSFVNRSNFWGGQVGLRGEARYSCFFAQGTFKLALGVTSERCFIEGVTQDQFPGFPAVQANGGLLALPTNIGRHYHNEFAVVPEWQLKVGYQVCENLRFSVGYTGLYMSNVARPGDQIDLAINTNRLPRFAPGATAAGTEVGPPHPAFQFNQTSFWAQGLMGGIELKY